MVYRTNVGKSIWFYNNIPNCVSIVWKWKLKMRMIDFPLNVWQLWEFLNIKLVKSLLDFIIWWINKILLPIFNVKWFIIITITKYIFCEIFIFFTVNIKPCIDILVLCTIFTNKKLIFIFNMIFIPRFFFNIWNY